MSIANAQKEAHPPEPRSRFRLAMSVNTIVFMTVSIFAQKFLNDFALFIAYRTFEFPAFMADNLRYLLLAIVPSLAIGLAVEALWMRPFVRAVRAISGGAKIPVESYRAAIESVISLPYVVIAFNLLGFVAGFYFSTHKSVLLTSQGAVFLCQYVAGAVVCGYVQIVVNNLILAPPRARLKVRYVGKYKEPTEGQRSMLISISLAVYTMFTVVGVGQTINVANLIHDRIYLRMAVEGADQATAIEEYRQAVAAHLELPADRVAVDTGLEAKEVSPFLIYLPILAFLVGLSVFIQIAADRNRRAQYSSLEVKMRSIIEGKADLTQRLVIAQFDELGALADTINEFIERLKELFAQFSEAGEKVGDSSLTLQKVLAETMTTTEMMVKSIEETNTHALSQASVVSETERALKVSLESLQRISDHVDAQASAAEQTSAAVSEMAANIQSVSRASVKANEVAQGLTEVAKGGNEAVENAARAIREVEAASARVNSIVEVISKIAAQTNLLAMNAAIEAAHAGSAGSGFAVVASEVRSLAESSAKSARDIAVQIRDMKKLIADNVSMAEGASEALKRIGRDIDSTTALIGQISSGMAEQDEGANEIVGAMSALVEASQGIRDIAEIQKRDSEEMRNSIVRLVDVFEDIRSATGKQADGNRGIMEGINRLQAVANENREVVGKLQDLLRGFVIKGEDQSVIKKRD